MSINLYHSSLYLELLPRFSSLFFVNSDTESGDEEDDSEQIAPQDQSETPLQAFQGIVELINNVS